MATMIDARIAARGEALMRDYGREHAPGEGLRTVLADILADLMVAAEALSLDWHGAAELAYAHYVVETTEAEL